MSLRMEKLFTNSKLEVFLKVMQGFRLVVTTILANKKTSLSKLIKFSLLKFIFLTTSPIDIAQNKYYAQFIHKYQ